MFVYFVIFPIQYAVDFFTSIFVSVWPSMACEAVLYIRLM